MRDLNHIFLLYLNLNYALFLLLFCNHTVINIESMTIVDYYSMVDENFPLNDSKEKNKKMKSSILGGCY